MLVLCPGLLPGATGPDVQRYLIAKGQLFRQAGTSLPMLRPSSEEPFVWQASVEARDANAVRTATFSRPGGMPVALVRRESHWEWSARFTTQAAQDGAAPPGSHVFTVDTASTGPTNLTRPLGVDAYPATPPRIVSATNLQGADPSLPLTIQWQPLSGGTTNDFIRLTLEEAGVEVFSSGEPGEVEALDGTRTFVTIPAGLLHTNASCRIQLLFARVASLDRDPAGTTGLTAFFRQTEFAFTMGSPASPPPAAGRFVFSSAAYEVAEGAGLAHVTLLRLGAANVPAGVTLSTRAGTATPGTDYLETNHTLFLDAGVNALSVPLAILEDASLEAGETILLRLGNPTGGADLGSLSNAVLTLTDNEQASRGVIQFAPAQATVDEGAGQVRLTLTRTGGSEGTVTVRGRTLEGTAGDTNDFTGGEYTVVFTNGVTSQTLLVPIVDDDGVEPAETFTVKLTEATGGAALGNARAATVTIRDNDAPDLLSFSAAAYSVSEAEPQVLLTVRRAGIGKASVSADFATEDLTARSPDDYLGARFTLVLAANELARTIPIPIQPDRLAEGSETFRATLRNASPGARLGPITNALITLLDDEIGLQFSSLNYSNREGSSLALLTVERTGPLTGIASVEVATLDGGTATPGQDYVPTNRLVFFPVNSPRQTVGIRLLNDQRVEGDETIRVQLANPSANALLGSRSQATLTLVEDDAGGTIQFALSALRTPESNPGALIVITRILGLASNITCRLATRDLTALDGQDYLGTNVVLAWQADETRKLIRLPLRPNQLMEGDRQFEVTLSEPTGGATLGPRTNLTVIIQDDDQAGVIGFARRAWSVSETASNAPVVIHRRNGDAGGVRVRFLARPGTAASPDDFLAQDVVVEFGPGQSSQTVLVPIRDDSQAEGAPETIRLVLQEITGGATLSAASNATLHVVDDEPSLAFSSATASGPEGTRIVLTIERFGPLTNAVSVDYRTLDGTATAGSDYTAASGTLTFAPNQSSRTISVLLTEDRTVEADETFSVVLDNLQGDTPLVAPSAATVTILDQCHLSFTSPTATGTEGGQVTLTVLREGGLDRSVTVDCQILNGTAQAGLDYAAASGTLTFEPGQTNRTLTIPLRVDLIRENKETFSVTLRNPQGGAQLEIPASVMVTLFDQPWDMALIPAGSFAMGETFANPPNPLSPVHHVFLSDYFIGKCEVTKGQWDTVFNWAVTNGYHFVHGGGGKATNHPVLETPWYDALKWCNARSEMEGRIPAYYTDSARSNVYRTGWLDIRNDWVRWNGGYRLPTEAEWEKAARGGVAGERFHFGNTITHAQANYLSVPELPYDLSPTRGLHPVYGALDDPYTSPVGSFAPNRYGLYDMAGNVLEMCWDWFAEDYYSWSPAVDPRGPATGTERLYRGGGWLSQAWGCSSAFRFGKDTGGPGYRDRTRGFRLVLAPGQP